MKTLTLLRHAKSGWDDQGLRDFDRPLNPKGRRAAQLIGRHLKAQGITFDRVVASPARRVVETLAEVAGGYGAALEPTWDKRAYLASAEQLIEIAHEGGAAGRLLIVAHNPGLEDLVTLLGGAGDEGLRTAAREKYPTATVAELTFEGGWAAVEPGTGTLTRFVRPRDLDPTLGPDRD